MELGDLFPNFRESPFTVTKKEHLRDCIDKVFNTFQTHFDTKEDLINFVNQIERREDAELFLRLGLYYNVCKNYMQQPFIKLIMIISIIERLATKEKKYVAFKDWILNNENIEAYRQAITDNSVESIRRFLEQARERYHERYGSIQNVFDFFKTHVIKEDQIKMISSFRAKIAGSLPGFLVYLYPEYSHLSIEEVAEKRGLQIDNKPLPLCYDWRSCLINYKCHPIRDKEWCQLWSNDNLLNRSLQKIVRIIYDFRSIFVHEARFMPFSGGTILGLYRGNPIFVDLTSENLANIFERAYINYFNNLMRRIPNE